MAGARVAGTEAESFQGRGGGDRVRRSQGSQGLDWRRKREEFVSSLRLAREAARHVKRGGDPRDLPPPPVSDTSHYIECPHCHRRSVLSPVSPSALLLHHLLPHQPLLSHLSLPPPPHLSPRPLHLHLHLSPTSPSSPGSARPPPLATSLCVRRCGVTNLGGEGPGWLQLGSNKDTGNLCLPWILCYVPISVTCNQDIFPIFH